MSGQEIHVDLLQLYCRVCGKRSVAQPKNSKVPLKNGVALKQSPMFRTLLSQIHDVDIDHESPEIFPKRVCQRCVEKFRNVRVTVQALGSDPVKVNVFELVNSLYINNIDDDLRYLARKFPVADFWAHSSSIFQQCGVCDDASSNQIISQEFDQVRTCHISVRETETIDEWGENSTDTVKSYRVTDIRDIIVTIKTNTPAKDPGANSDGASTPSGMKRTHSETSVRSDEQKDASEGPTTPAPNLSAAASPAPSGNGESEPKKAKIETPPEETAAKPVSKPVSSAPPSQLSSTPAPSPSTFQTLWPIFSELLEKNRKYRSDKIAEILDQYQTEVPKVISDLKSSGITYKPSNRQNHFVKNAEFKNSIQRCFALLHKVPTPKKSLLLFRAVTDTASDGQLNILSYVGIDIDLSNPNLGFLLRRIKSREDSQQAQKQIVQKQKAAASRQAATSDGGHSKEHTTTLPSHPHKTSKSKIDEDYKPLSSQRKKIPTAKVASSKSSSLPAALEPPAPQGSGPTIKIKTSPATPVKSSSTPAKASSSSFSSSSNRPLVQKSKKLPDVNIRDELLDDVNINAILLKTKVRQLNTQIPVNRQMKADIIRDVLLRRTDTKELMASHGILFDPEGGNYHLKALDQQRGNGRKKLEKLTSSLNIYEWRACIAYMVYDLLHPEDSLTLRIVGIFIDPTHEKVPLHFRLNFALKRTLLMSPLSAPIMNHLYDNVPVLGKGDAQIDTWEMGLVELLYCDRKDAKQLFNVGRTHVKTANKNSVKASPQSTTPKVPPIVISKGKATPAPLTPIGTRGKNKSITQQLPAKNATTPAPKTIPLVKANAGQAKSIPLLKNPNGAKNSNHSRSPVIVQLRPKKGQQLAPQSGASPTVVRLIKSPPKPSNSRPKRKSEVYRAKTKNFVQPEEPRSHRRATRNKTEQRIHEMAKLENMPDHLFEGEYGGATVQHNVVELEQDPLYDPLGMGFIDYGSAIGSHQHQVVGTATLTPVQTETFMPNLVEIKSEIFDEYDQSLEDGGGVSPGSHHSSDHDDTVDVQDDLEHVENETNLETNNHQEEEEEEETEEDLHPPPKTINHHPHIINQDDSNVTEDEDEEMVEENDSAEHDQEIQIGESAQDPDPSQMEASTDNPVDENQSLNESSMLEDHEPANHDEQDNPQYDEQVNHQEEDHPDDNDEADNQHEVPDEEMEEESGFSELQISNVASAVNSQDGSPSFEEVVSPHEQPPEKENGQMINAHFDENTMQQLESLEEMLSFSAHDAGPQVEVQAAVGPTEEFDFEQFVIPPPTNNKDVLGTLVNEAFGYTKGDDDGSSQGIESVDSIIQAAAGMNNIAYDQTHLP